MLTYGIVKDSDMRQDGTFWIKVRIPSIHGSDNLSLYDGRTVHNLVQDKDLPWYQSVYLQNIPKQGDIVALESLNSSNNEFIVIGLMKSSVQGGDVK